MADLRVFTFGLNIYQGVKNLYILMEEDILRD